jgi:hypothetical protein
MILPRITSVCLATGGVKRPWRDRDFHFELAPLTPGGGQLDLDRVVRVDTYGEAAELALGGMGLRMADERGGRNKWVLPRALGFTQAEPGTKIDELWSQTLPPAPVTREAVRQELRKFLRLYVDLDNLIAGTGAVVTNIAWYGRRALATAAEQPDFGFARLVEAAYDSAFRTGCDVSLDAAQALDCERALCLMHALGPWTASKGSGPDLPALKQTLLSAALRQRLAGRYVSYLDLEATVPQNLAMLANMSYQGARNALANQGISTLRGKLDCEAICSWLQQRLGFAPWREAERPEAAATQSALTTFRDLPIRQALVRLRKALPDRSPNKQLSDMEETLRDYPSQGNLLINRLWRDYARHLNLCIDTFVVGMAEIGSIMAIEDGPVAAVSSRTRPRP